MTAIELRDHLKAAAAMPLLLDVREPWEHRLSSMPEAMLIPMQEIPARVADLDKARETVVICHLGVRSRYVAAFLERQGFDKVINLSGGIDAWSVDVDPTVPRY